MRKKKILALSLCIIAISVLIFYFGAPRATVFITSFSCSPNSAGISDTLYVTYTLHNDLSTPQTAYDLIVLENDDNPGSWCGYLYVPETAITIPANGNYQGSHYFTVEEGWLNCLYNDNSFKLILDVQYIGGNDVTESFIVQYIPPPTYSVNVYTNPNNCVVVLDGTITQTSTSNTVFTDVPAGSHTLETTKTGFITDTRTITVVGNTEVLVTLQQAPTQPTLEILADSNVQTNTSFQVTVKSANVPIIGAKLTLQWSPSPFYTDNSGSVTLTAPSVATDTIYTITANKTGYADDVFPITITVGAPPDEHGIPGFEILALIGAIGATFIILRNRKEK